MRLLLLRHPKVHPSVHTIYGRTDVPVDTALVDRHARAVRALLGNFGSAELWTSPSRRCASFSSLLCSDFRTDERLREVDFGQWEGRSWGEISPEESEAYFADFVHTPPPGGESLAQMAVRVESFVHDLRGNAVFLSHAGVLRIVLGHCLGLPLSQIFRIAIPDAAYALCTLDLECPQNNALHRLGSALELGRD